MLKIGVPEKGVDIVQIRSIPLSGFFFLFFFFGGGLPYTYIYIYTADIYIYIYIYMVPPLEYSGFWQEICILAVQMHAKHTFQLLKMRLRFRLKF